MSVSQEFWARLSAVTDEMISEMTAAVPTENISESFIRQIIPFLGAAYKMSNEISELTTNARISRFSNNTARAAEDFSAAAYRLGKEIPAVVNRKRDCCVYNRNADIIMNNMFYRMSAAIPQRRTNCDFISKIIPHHEGGILFCENALKFDIEFEVKVFARAAAAFLSENKSAAAEISAIISCECGNS